MKVTHFGPGGFAWAHVSNLGGTTVTIGSNTNTDPPLSSLNFVQAITVDGVGPLLRPIVNVASGSNITLTIDRGPGNSTPSNTVRIHATGGGSVSYGSNATRVSEIPSVGALTTVAREDHIHDGIGTITASSSNTLQRGTVNLRSGNNVSFGLTDGDGDGELDTVTIHAAASGGGGGGSSSVETYAQAITAIGSAVHRWKFDESSGNFADSIGSLTLVASGAFTYSVSAPLGGAVTFGAAAKGQASGVGSIPTGSGARTFVCVFKGQSTKAALMSYGTSGSTRQWWTGFLNDSGGSSFGSLGLATWADDFASGANTLDLIGAEWHFAAFMYDAGTTIKVFYDAHYANIRGLAAGLNTGSGTDFRVGIDTTGASQFSGSMDDLVVFSKYLTIAECERLATAFFHAVSP